MNDVRVTKFPLDFEALSKDSWIDGEELETALGCTPDDVKAWQLGMLSLCSRIRDESSILARQDGDRIRLMTDAEADEYNFRYLFGSGMRKLRKAAENVATYIDPEALTDGEKRLHESRSRIIAMTTQATMRQLDKQKRVERLLAAKTS